MQIFGGYLLSFAVFCRLSHSLYQYNFIIFVYQTFSHIIVKYYNAVNKLLKVRSVFYLFFAK